MRKTLSASQICCGRAGSKLVQGNWEIPHGRTGGRVEYRISRWRPPPPQMPSSPSPFDAKHIRLVVVPIEYRGIYQWNIRVDRYQVPGQIAVDEIAPER